MTQTKSQGVIHADETTEQVTVIFQDENNTDL